MLFMGFNTRCSSKVSGAADTGTFSQNLRVNCYKSMINLTRVLFNCLRSFRKFNFPSSREPLLTKHYNELPGNIVTAVLFASGFRVTYCGV